MRILSLLLLLLPVARGVEWKPINPSDLALKEPKVDKNADAEAIFWDVRVYDTFRSFPRTEHVIENYVRVKIYNDRGAKAQATVDVPYTPARRQTVTDVKGRTIKADGTITDMKGDAIFDKTNVKVGRRVAMKTRSFTLPAVEPGSVIEYQWREVYSEYVPWATELRLSRDIPVWRTTYLVRPLQHEAITEKMRPYPFNCDPPKWTLVKTPETFFMTYVDNVPANADEPYSPPDDEVQPWILIYYSSDETKDPRQFWPKLGKRLNESYKKEIKVSSEVKALAAEATAGAATPEEKMLKIAEYCRTKIKNTAYEVNGITAEDKSKFKHKEFHNSSDTAKGKIGWPGDMNPLFVAMAQAAGLEARGVRAAQGTNAWFRGDLSNEYLLTRELAAVKIGEQWKFVDVSNPYVPAGMVFSDTEGMVALVLDDKEPKLAQVPFSSPNNTMSIRKAKLKLNDDGSLEGRVEVMLTGHRGASMKSRLEEQSDAKRKEDLEKQVKALHGDAELSKLTIENVTDPLQPFKYSYELKVSGYAQRTGKRLFFQPSFFEHGKPALFASKDRKYPISFPFPFHESDVIEIEMPEGFKLENAEAPGRLELGKVGEYQMQIGIRNNKVLTVQRDLIWGKEGQLLFPAQGYPQLKGAFDVVHQQDEHMLTLRQQ